MTEECVGPVVSKLECILTYDGAHFDTALNYGLILVNALPFLSTPNPYARAGLLAFYCVFQIALCLALGCSGVSIVWCACLGAWALDERGAARDRVRCIAIAAADGAALVYYAATSEALTSVAHACALAMGALTAHGRQLLSRRAAYDSLLSAPVARAAASADHGSSPDP